MCVLKTITCYFLFIYFLVFLCAIFERKSELPICPEMESSFYVTLPSNVKSNNDSANNTVANYKTTLAKNLFLSSDWEVGLCEISYTASWYNIPRDQKLTIYDSVGDLIRGTLTAGYYGNATELTSHLNAIFEAASNYSINPELVLDKQSGKIKLVYGQSKAGHKVLVELDSDLSQVLGFGLTLSNMEHIKERMKRSINESELASSTPFDMRNGYYNMFVYSDILKPSLVGDSYSQLLRVLQIPSEITFGQQITQTFDSPHYVPILNTNISSIEIDIKDDTGNTFPFEFGRTNIILHFRQKSI